MKSLASKKEYVHRTEAVNAKNKIFRISKYFCGGRIQGKMLQDSAVDLQFFQVGVIPKSSVFQQSNSIL